MLRSRNCFRKVYHLWILELFLKIYFLFQRQRTDKERQTNILHPLAYSTSSHNGHIGQSRACLRSGASCGSPTWVQGPKDLDNLPRSLAGIWMGNEAAQTWNGVFKGCWRHRKGLSLQTRGAGLTLGCITRIFTRNEEWSTCSKVLLLPLTGIALFKEYLQQEQSHQSYIALWFNALVLVLVRSWALIKNYQRSL